LALSFKNIAPYLNMGQNRFSRAISYTGLGIGVLLLLCSVQLYVNINQLIKDRNPRKDGYDFISVTKKITNENMGQNHSFSEADINEMKAKPFIEDATPLVANQFLVKATGGSTLPFTSDLFLEAIDNRFLDTLPPSFTWKEGQPVVPIIISSDYLELYNTVFAPSRDLPQFSERSISAIIIRLECYGTTGTESFRGNIVALSDRVNSILVPKNFLEWANNKFSGTGTAKPSRIFIKTPDANSVELLNFIQEKNYQVNKDKTKFGRVKQVLQAIVSGLGGFAILVILLAMMLFSFYLQLMIARSKDNLQLLLTLGYSPAWLSKVVAKKWIPVYAIIIMIAFLLAAAAQYLFQHNFLNGRDELSPFLHYSVMLTAVTLLVLCIAVNYSLIKKLLYKL
jgi:hypothetical protein